MSDYDAIYSQDSPTDGITHGWVQWKGTDVCMDIYCTCGYQDHFDGEFFYRFQCPKCKQIFAVGQNIKMIPLTPEQIANDPHGGPAQNGGEYHESNDSEVTK